MKASEFKPGQQVTIIGQKGFFTVMRPEGKKVRVIQGVETPEWVAKKTDQDGFFTPGFMVKPDQISV